MTTVQDRVKLEVMREMDEQLVALAGIKSADERLAKWQELQEAQTKTINERVKATQEAEKAKSESERQAKDAFQAHAKDLFKELWDNLFEGANNITTMSGISFQVMRQADVEGMPFGEPTIVLGGIKQIARSVAKTVTNGTGSRGNPLTVDGHEYPSASAAKDALLPGRAGKSMSRKAIVDSLVGLNHTVS